jgi:glycerol kinase
MNEKFILSLDQGTTSSRAVIYNALGDICSISQKEFTQHFPKPGWVEHDPMEIWSSQLAVASEAVLKLGITPGQIAAIGITNQRETTIVWNKKTGMPIHNAIVWQDRRTADYCDSLKQSGFTELVRKKTGLEIDAYFSATKIKWLLHHVPGAREHANKGELAFGTVDTWLIWNLTGGASHLTDITNASRTMLFNINTLTWDEELLEMFDIPAEILPQVQPTSSYFAETAGNIIKSRIPICGVAGDQQAAMFGQMCIREGMVKNTYGTGCFLMMNIGGAPLLNKNRLITTIAWQIGNQVVYAFEGSVFTAGAVVQWLRDGLKLISRSSEIEQRAAGVADTDGVYFVPAFSGLGAPYWNPNARGTITGMHRGTTDAHIARAALESIAFQSNDVMQAMRQGNGFEINAMRVDGGAAVNDLLMQLQSDISQIEIERARTSESTSLGAAFFAGIESGYWKDISTVESLWSGEKVFSPSISRNQANAKVKSWKQAVKRTLYT